MLYLDHAASTYPYKEAVAKAFVTSRDYYGNPSSSHGFGVEANREIRMARNKCAELIGSSADEIYFTSGGTESNNLALFGTLRGGDSVIVSSIEHSSIMNTCKRLTKRGVDVTYVGVSKGGVVNLKEIEDAITNRTRLISIMSANNEIGTLEPVAEVGAIAKERNILFHTDAVQAVGAVPVNVQEWNADLLSISAHKFYGPKGTGALYVRRGTRIDSLIHGGEQERGLRAGTENVPAIVGLGKAIENANRDLDKNAAQTALLRDRLISGIMKEIPGTRLNGTIAGRLPNNCNISFEGIDGEALLLRLDLAGIAASSGSACTAGNQEVSHVLKAIGLTENEAKGSLRLTTGIVNTEKEMDETVCVISEIVKDLRSLFHG